MADLQINTLPSIVCLAVIFTLTRTTYIVIFVPDQICSNKTFVSLVGFLPHGSKQIVTNGARKMQITFLLYPLALLILPSVILPQLKERIFTNGLS